MKTTLQSVSERVWKGKIMLILFLLFAACTQADESIAPSDAHRTTTTDLTTDEGANLREGNSAVPQTTFIAHLQGGNEIPANDAQGQGQANFFLSDDGTELHYRLNVANATDITQAHIHCGTDDVNGPVVVFLFGFDAEGVTQNGILARGTITAADVISRAPNAACSGGLATFEELVERMRSGDAYVNVHTLEKPGGEIRGQIK